MRQSPALERYKVELRPELLAALTKNELERGYKPRVAPKPRDEAMALDSLAEKIRKEGPCPISFILREKLKAKAPKQDAAE